MDAEVYVRIFVARGKDPATVQGKLKDLLGNHYIGSTTLRHPNGTPADRRCNIVIGLRGPRDKLEERLQKLREHQDVVGNKNQELWKKG
jgi:hypothetical protein